MTKLFITGVTGYIGGDALYNIATTYPDLEITALVRNSDKGAKVAVEYPKIRLVYGDLDSTDLLTTEASKADIVLHCADADHVGAATALTAGLAQKEKPGFIIHTSGTGLLGLEDLVQNTRGVKREKVYDDWDGVGEVTSLPDMALHRNVDKIILAAGTQYPGKVFTAIVCPPCINGPGRGPDNKRSVQSYGLSKVTLERGKGLCIDEGTNIWSDVNVQDLSNVFLRLVEEAHKGGGSATWGAEGYYFAENGEFVWGDVSKAIAKAAYDQKLIDTPEVDSITSEEAKKLYPSGDYLWGTNSRSRAVRARKILGWKPVQKSLLELIPDIVVEEAKALGLVTGHAVKAAGDK
ncbi:NAD dependent epimerase/dehydratase family protein [Delitschia confertaspora ATCC 74209]|uniref:NAD dependent epimerase/dehydratase family protein n=1 Tax=Delitschia confertaspora ATCC 74209 TaxID=1513339 RepID=A0A9P4JJ89_9PLEO|nr:NAD dependent epimerase/dehydratase family protein [Delitschia confertaspora ATCC 74209]